jgi:uncharacterized protein YecT (DUF1311 family)
MIFIAFILALLGIQPAVHAGEFKSTDQELNRVYQEVLKSYQNNPEFIVKLRASQRTWVQFRDAQLEAMFPSKDKQGSYGSVYPTCAANELNELTEARIRQLRVWLDGTKEGDVCAGSVRIIP